MIAAPATMPHDGETATLCEPEPLGKGFHFLFHHKVRNGIGFIFLISVSNWVRSSINVQFLNLEPREPQSTRL